MNDSDSFNIPKVYDADNCLQIADDPTQFELYCLSLARKWASLTLKPPYRIEYRTHEPIDILIEEAEESTPNLPKMKHVAGQIAAPRHFIECKLYGRDLSLSVVGAPYLHAFRQRPRTLVIATNRELTGGAKEFASWLFNIQMSGTTKLCTWNPFAEDDAVDPECAEAAAGPAGSVHRPPVAIDRWSLREPKPFQDITVASSDGENCQEHSMRLGANVVFRAILRNPVRGRRIDSVTLTFTAPGYADVQVPLERVSEIAGGLEMQGVICACDFHPGVTYHSPNLDVAMSGGWDNWCGLPGFPFLRVESKAIVLPDLRGDETETLYDRWMRRGTAPILLVQGEGGAGKTYLCERLAESAVQAGFRTAHSPLELRTELAFVAEIVWQLLSPDLRALLKETDRTLTGSLLFELGAACGASIPESEAAALATLLLEGRWEGSSPDLLLQTIAQLIVRSHRPLLFVISNAHRLSDSVASGIRTLLGAIEAAGWGQVRLIVEARDTPEDLGSDWLNLKGWMFTALGHRITEHTVQPLDEPALLRSLPTSIVSSDGELLTSLVYEKTGGNPLFLTHLLQSLLEQDVIAPLPPKPSTKSGVHYSLSSISRLRTVVTGMGGTVEELLVGRIRFWDDRLSSAAAGWGGYTLGLMSLLGSEVSVELLAALTARRPDAIETTLLSFDMAGLVARRPNETFGFSHEFAAAAAGRWLAAQHDFHARIAEVADRPADVANADSFSIALSKGRLHAFLKRQVRALDALNAALQLAGTNFDNIFRCRRDMHQVLSTDATGGMARQFHANLHEYLKAGYYIVPCERNLELNRQALAVLQHTASNSLSRAERKAYARRYRHNLSNLALRSLDPAMFFEHASSVLESCTTPLELAQFLNRIIKVCSITGSVGTGRRFGEIATALQTVIPPADDADLEAVLLGEMSFLYATVSPRTASDLAEEAIRKGVTERQRAHDLFARACARLRLGDAAAGKTDLQSLEDLAGRLALKTMAPGIDMLHGVLALFRSSWQEASSSFRFAMADVAWLGHRRDELRIGTNLVAARALSGDMEAASGLNDALLSIATRVCRDTPETALADLLPAVQARVEAERAWNIEKARTFPDSAESGPHMVAPLLLNAEALHRFAPERFSAPSRFGFTAEIMERLAVVAPGYRVFESKIGLPLYVVC